MNFYLFVSAFGYSRCRSQTSIPDAKSQPNEIRCLVISWSGARILANSVQAVHLPIKIGDLGENDPSSVLMKLTAITSGQKTNGVFYTPNPMARFVSIKALQTLKKSALDHKSISVLEPSIGSGVFVRELLPLIEKKKTFGGLNHLQKVQIIGIDLSPAAILVTEFLLANFDCQLESKLRISLFAGNTLSSELHPIYQEFESWRLSNDNTSKQKSGGRSDANTSLQIKPLFQKAVREKKIRSGDWQSTLFRVDWSNRSMVKRFASWKIARRRRFD